jgi:glutathione S-transferase
MASRRSTRKLFQFSYSPYAAKVRICLALKDLAYELVEVPYTDRAALVKVSGGVGIPVLVDGANVISDSPRIVEWIDLADGPSLRANPLSLVLEQWSDGPLEDAAFRFACPGLEDRMGEEQGEEARLMFRLVKERKYGAGVVAQWRSERLRWLEETKALLLPIAFVLADQPWVLPGDEPSVADAAIAGQLYMMECAEEGVVEAELPELAPWYQHLTR